VKEQRERVCPPISEFRLEAKGVVYPVHKFCQKTIVNWGDEM